MPYADPEQQRLAKNRSMATPAGKARLKRYHNTEKGRTMLRSAVSRYHKSEKGKEARARYKRSPHGKLKCTVNANIRRARALGAEGVFTSGDVDELFRKQDGVCLCGVSLACGYEVDHKTPLSRGGNNWPSNLQLLCSRCNSAKGARTMAEWAPTGGCSKS